MSVRYESYQYIYPPKNRAYNADDVLSNKYDLAGIIDKFVVYSHGIGYRVYNSPDDYIEHFHAMRFEERTFNEVIFNRAQKLKFDIDAPVDKLQSFEAVLDDELAEIFEGIDLQTPAEKYSHIHGVVVRAIADAFFVIYGFDCELILCESVDPTGGKFSSHILINQYGVSSSTQVREFTRRMMEYLPKTYHAFIDVGVNKSVQNFRLAGCHKVDDLRVKEIKSGHDLRSSLVTIVDSLLPDICAEEKKNPQGDVCDSDVQKILDVCRDAHVMDHHEYKHCRGGMLLFTRTSGSMCKFCKRVHDLDSTLLIGATRRNSRIYVYEYCRKYLDEQGKTGEHKSLVGTIESDMSGMLDGDARLTGWVDATITRQINNNVTFDNAFDRLDPARANVYDEPAMRPFELTHTLVVKAMMKMGKTKCLKKYIETNFAPGLRNPIIRMISFRQTFSNELKSQFEDFTLYSDVKGPLDQARLIVQVESLHRLAIRPGDECPDLTVLDECDSIFEQFNSGLVRNYECFSKFQYLIAHSRHVICMDANAGDRTYNVLSRMRPGFGAPENGVVYHHNKYRNATADNYYLTGDRWKWLGILYSSVEADERVAVPMSSLTEAKILVHNLTKKYPEKSIKLYSSETLSSEKAEHFGDVNTYWKMHDVLVYTPTVSAGVSFEHRHFHKVFGYFTDQSCPAETCTQMMGRIRDVADHQYYIYLNATGNNLPTNIDDIRDQLLDSRSNLYRELDDSGLTINYTADGVRHYTPNDYFHLWLENTRMKNLSRNLFIERIIHLIKHTGASVHELTEAVYETHTGQQSTVDGELNDDLVIIRDQHSKAKSDIRADTCKKIADARDLDEFELEEIHSAIISQQDITEDQRHAFEKHRLRTDYKYAGVIDEKFVDRYRDQRTRRIFKNINRVYGVDMDTALSRIQSEERANYTFVLDMGVRAEYYDLHRNYMFEKHRCALGLIKLCGWTGIDDPQYIHKVILMQNIQCEEYWKLVVPAHIELALRTPARNIIGLELIKPINRVISTMYGIQITSRKNDPDMFFISQNKMFAFSANQSADEGMPLVSG